MAAPAGTAAAAPAAAPAIPRVLEVLLHPTNPNPNYAFHMLGTMSDREIVDLLNVYPQYAGYVVICYGRMHRWRDNWLTLLSSRDAEGWHRERDRQRQLKNQRDVLSTNRALAFKTPLERPYGQRIMRLDIELENIKRQFLERTLRRVQRNQTLWTPLLNLVNPTPLQRQYLWWRGYIRSILRGRILDCWVEIARLIEHLAALGPNPVAPARPIGRGTRFPGEIARLNTSTVEYPCLIDMLVERDCVEALRWLRHLGVFDPISYHRTGVTMLHYALRRNNRRVSRYLLETNLPRALWVRQHGTPALANWTYHSGNELETLLQQRKLNWFTYAWNRIYPTFATMPHVRGTRIFEPESREVLCTVANLQLAEELAAVPLSLDLAAIQPMAMNGAVQIQGGTIWHLAVLNTNLHFLDFVGRQRVNWTLINQPNNVIPRSTPLERAIALDRTEHAARLIQYGATIPRHILRQINTDLPTTTDLLWRTVLWSTQTDLRIGAGTHDGGWLYDVVSGLHDRLRTIHGDPRMTKAQKKSRSSKATSRATQLIKAIRRGTDFSPPVDINMVDTLGRTAWEMAEEWDLPGPVIRELQ
ncbi:hypothetical protein BJY01DRAFT_249749 [Aspergillus pseudoustus]|uniref:Ankyrin repeat-containing domain protein n=1 Tax=Aspergillus pseudoustus TaxID=1810923 RepID=A0ABR4JLZ4_9EURO